ncbi:MAG: rhomboid family intramembrane serine protease [Flavobacteriaceae bacterium]|nr:rhomboid family intramembrane serine protease [Flavobacteriaceae bacterium]
MATNNLLYQFKKSSIVIKLIAINIVVFLLINLSSFFFSIPPAILTKWLVLPENIGDLITQPWSLFTYSFLHFGLFHLLFNMLWLNWFGKYILNLFSEKRFLTLYLLGGFFGGLLFILSYNVLPVFKNQSGYLLGASGAVMAVIVFIATYTPNTSLRFFTLTIKLWQIALFLFLFDLLRLPTSGNEGGLIAHVGGAIFGYVYAIQLAKGNDIGKWFENILDWFVNQFKPRSKRPFKKVHKTTHAKKAKTKTKANNSKDEHQKKIDAILDKIGKSGYESLTKAEKDFLFKAGKED